MTDIEEVQGTRTGPLVGSLVLLLLSCILIQLSLNSDWASMSAEVEYTDLDKEWAELWGVDLPEISMTVSFGLTDLTTVASNDGEETEETSTLEEYVEENADRERQFLDMDWDEWHSTGKSTSIALWIGFIAAILGSIMALVGVIRTNDTAHGGGIILCGLAAALINAGWFNWIVFGGSFVEFTDIGGDGFKSDGFGVTTGFILCIIAGILMLAVPFVLAWSQELPIDKLLPLNGGFSELEMRQYQPSVRLNATIVIMLACLLVVSGVGQGVASVFFYSENPQHSPTKDDDDSETTQELIPWISILPVYDWETAQGVQQTINDGQTRTILFFENADFSPLQFFTIHFDCNDGGNGETGAPNAQDETDILHWTISSDNGQERSGSLDCDGEDEWTEMENEGNEEWINWYEEIGADYMVYHDEEDADSVMETAPSTKNMFPITVEFTAETRGDTLEQNQDNELEFTISPCGDESCDVVKETFHFEYDRFMAAEDAMEHEHYNGSS